MCRISLKKLTSLVIALAGLTSLLWYLDLCETSYVTRDVIEEDQSMYRDDMPPLPAVVQRDVGHYMCILHTNVVYIFAPGSDSEILQCILTRFGYLKDLFVTLPIAHGNTRVGHERGYDDVRSTRYLRPPSVTSPKRVYREETINIFAQPARFDKDAMRKMFPENARYVAILRRPLDRFVEDFLYSKLEKHFSATLGSGSPKNYLDNPEYWEKLKTTSYCTRNCMSAVLGFPLDENSDIRDTQAAMDYIKQLDSDFSLVLIYEYFDQSLVLLRRYMCWSVLDIMYYLGPTQLKRQQAMSRVATEAHVRNFRRVNSLDYLVYDYFNRTLWERVTAEGPDFHSEVQNFHRIQKEVVRYCRTAVGNWASANHTSIRASRWHEEFNFTRAMCYKFGRSKHGWEELLKERYFAS